MQTKSTEKVQHEFLLYLQESTVKYLTVKLALGILILIYFAYSDLAILSSIGNFYSRLLPLSVAVPLLIFHLFTKQKFKYVKTIIFNGFITALLISMYCICIVHLYQDTLTAAVTAAVFVIFIISLEIKSNTIITVLIYFVPTLILFLILVLFYNIPAEKHLILSNIYMFIIVSFALNRIQNTLRFKAFLSNYRLNLEKQKTDNLYKNALEMNVELNRSHQEITIQRDEIEQKNKELQNKNEEIESQAGKIEHANKMLHQLNVAKDKFYSIISHDLKNPFNAIQTLSDLLIRKFDDFDGSTRKDYISSIHRGIKEINNLLRNLIEWSRSQRGLSEFNPVEVNLNLLAAEACKLLDNLAANKAISIKNSIDENILVEADRNMLSIIFRNLISNAIKYTPDDSDGMVVLNARKISDDSGKEFIEISVQDTGVGITDEKQNKLFMLSGEMLSTETEEEGETGIGLVLNYELVQLHGGKIWVESQPNAGTTFYFTLPV